MRHLCGWLLALTISVSPHVGFSGTKVNVEVKHRYEQGDRWLRIGIYCNGDEVTISDRGIDPANRPFYRLSMRLTEPCTYEVVATVVKWDDSTLSARTKVEIHE